MESGILFALIFLLTTTLIFFITSIGLAAKMKRMHEEANIMPVPRELLPGFEWNEERIRAHKILTAGFTATMTAAKANKKDTSTGWGSFWNMVFPSPKPSVHSLPSPRSTVSPTSVSSPTRGN